MPAGGPPMDFHVIGVCRNIPLMNNYAEFDCRYTHKSEANPLFSVEVCMFMTVTESRWRNQDTNILRVLCNYLRSK